LKVAEGRAPFLLWVPRWDTGRLGGSEWRGTSKVVRGWTKGGKMKDNSRCRKKKRKKKK